MVQTELEKQRALNERLENDLLHMETHNTKTVNGDTTPADTDALAGLELGKKVTVSPLSPVMLSPRYNFVLMYIAIDLGISSKE